jgi:hypothetical protein
MVRKPEKHAQFWATSLNSIFIASEHFAYFVIKSIIYMSSLFQITVLHFAGKKISETWKITLLFF